MLNWKKLAPKEIESICLANLSSSNCDNLKTLIKKYKFDKYSYVDDSVPLKYLLTVGNARTFYCNPANGDKFREKYGITNPYRYFHSDVFDHKILFKDSKGKVYLVSNPYVSNENTIDDIKKSIESFKSNKEAYGDLSDLKYEITDVSDSYYYPGRTVTIVFYM